MPHTTTKKKITFSDIKNDLSLSPSGGLALVFDEGSVKQSILTILTTKLGERVMLPSFGSILHEYLFEPMDYITEIQIKSAIITSLTTWEDRIIITGVRITAEPDNNSYIIEIRYNIILTKKTDVFIGRISAAEEVAAKTAPSIPVPKVVPPPPPLCTVAGSSAVPGFMIPGCITPGCGITGCIPEESPPGDFPGDFPL